MSQQQQLYAWQLQGLPEKRNPAPANTDESAAKFFGLSVHARR
jgi:hypothetical protein